MTQRQSRIGRLFAALFIRGAEAPFILRDLDDSFNHDVARGLAPAEVRRRDLKNILASAGSVWAASLRPSAWRPSLVDFRLGLRMILRTPGLSFVAICALAIGIPVGLAPMHAVDALERPLPGIPTVASARSATGATPSTNMPPRATTRSGGHPSDRSARSRPTG